MKHVEFDIVKGDLYPRKDPLDRPLFDDCFNPWRRRVVAICYCLFYGLVPWWMYEEACHHQGWGYWRHMWQNLLYMLKWVLFLEDEKDIEFEKSVNNN